MLGSVLPNKSGLLLLLATLPTFFPWCILFVLGQIDTRRHGRHRHPPQSVLDFRIRIRIRTLILLNQ